MADYDLRSYGRMLTHEARMNAYVTAIRAAVRPGDVVLDLGTGTGVMALLACQCGAKRVYALEPSEAIVIAQQAAKDNGFADRIIFHRAASTQVELPEKCDVLISDLRGATPCFKTHLADLIDARTRLLTANARWICAADRLFLGIVRVPNGAEQIATQWDGSAWGLDLRSALLYANSQISRHRAEPGDLLGPPQSWARIDYPAITTPHVRGTAQLTIAREGAAHGLLVWFAAELYGGAHFSNAPDQPPGVYTPMLLPWPESVALQPGDWAEVRLDVIFSGHDYWCNWHTVIRRPDRSEPLATFKQSTLHGQILDRKAIALHAPSFAPSLSHAAEEVLFVLQRMDGQTTQGVLARALRAKFPERFSTEEAAIACVSQIRLAYAQ